MEIPEEWVNKLTFEEFQRSCGKILSMSDEEIVKEFSLGPNDSVGEIRMKYNYIYKNVNREEYNKLQSAKNVNIHKFKGNTFLSRGLYYEATVEYQEALGCLTEIGDPALAKAAEQGIRLNLALIYLHQKNYSKVIFECEKILDHDPFNFKALYRISSAYAEVGDNAKAAEHLKRITIRDSTDDKFITLYNKIVGKRPNKAKEINDMIEKLNVAISEKDIVDAGSLIAREFRAEGIIAEKEEFKDLLSAPEADKRKLLLSKYKELDKKRRYEFFLRYPVIEDLVEDPELIEIIEKLAADKNSDFTKKMLGQFKNLTSEQLVESIKGIRFRSKLTKVLSFLPSKKSYTLVGCAVIVLVIAFLLYRHYYP